MEKNEIITTYFTKNLIEMRFNSKELGNLAHTFSGFDFESLLYVKEKQDIAIFKKNKSKLVFCMEFYYFNVFFITCSVNALYVNESIKYCFFFIITF